VSIALNPSAQVLPMHHTLRTASVASAKVAGAAQTVSDTVTLSTEAQAMLTQELRTSAATASAVDFTAMKPSELLDAMNDLIKSGRMSLDESSALLALVPTPLKPGMGGSGSTVNDDPMNVFQRLQEMIDNSLARQDNAVAQHVQKALTALDRMA